MRQTLLSNLSDIIYQLRKILLKAQNDEPVIYLEIKKGIIVDAYSTEEVIISIKDYDMSESNSDNTWDEMIEQGLNSGELTKISTM